MPNRNFLANTKLIHACSDSNVCFELRHLLPLGHSRVCFGRKICYWRWCFACDTGQSTWTHSACRKTSFTHNGSVQMCYTAETTLYVNVYLWAVFAQDPKLVDADRCSQGRRKPGLTDIFRSLWPKF